MQSSFLLSLIDLTRLVENDSVENITALCKTATSLQTNVAAVCVYPEYVSHVVSLLKNTPINIATVLNFPHGRDIHDPGISKCIAEGATEIDVVFPYEKYMQGDRQSACSFVEACKAACGKTILLKVIMETGAFSDAHLLLEACNDVITAGADFLKTSTGKIATGATLSAAEVLLHAIQKSKRPVGLKVSGGIKTIDQATQYINLANNLMGPHWVTPKTFRIGASQIPQPNG